MSKFEWTEEQAPKAIKNEMIICKNCFHRSGRTDICAAYQQVKPYSILNGGSCRYYKKEK